MIIPSKHSGYGEGGRLTSTRRVYDSGGGATQTQITDLPDWAKPTATKLLGDAGTLTDIGKNPYTPYVGQRTAQFTPLQQQAYGGAYGMNAGPEGFAQNVGNYMSPYMQNVVDREKMEAARASQMLGQQQQSQATQAGAFGGYREGIQRAERERGLRSQLQDIQSRGSQAAYDRAADQFRQGITQQMAVGQQQAQFGGQQQQVVQQMLDTQYQDFLNQKKYPYQQLEFLSNILRGTPMGGTSTMYGAPGSTAGQLAGIGAGLAGMFRAEGGSVSSYAEGGVTDVNNVRGILDKLSDQQLQEAQKAAAARGDTEQLQLIAAEMAQRSSMRQGIASALPEQFADSMEEGMATGGIVAFADRGLVEDGPTPEEIEAAKRPYIGTPMIARPRERAYGESNLASRIAEFLVPPTYAAEKPAKPAAAASTAPATVSTPVTEAPKETTAKKEAPKPTKQVAAAAKQVAAAAGVPETTLTDEAMALYGKMQELRKPDIDRLNAIIEAQRGRAEEIKGRGLSDALMNFGFTMAAEASKPGAGFLSSASKAAPTISKTMAENQQAVAAAQDAFNKAQAEQIRSEITGGGESMRSALTTAQNIMQNRLEQQRQRQLADYQNRALAAQGAGRTPALAQIAEEVMADPTFKGSKLDAMRIASGLINGVDIRTEGRLLEKANTEIADATKIARLQLATAKTPEERAKYQADIDSITGQVYRRYGIGGGGGSAPAAGGTVLRFDAKGNPIQ